MTRRPKNLKIFFPPKREVIRRNSKTYTCTGHEPTMEKSIQPHFRRILVIFPLMQRITVISNEHDGSLHQHDFTNSCSFGLRPKVDLFHN